MHIEREGEIKILNSKIKIFSKKSGNQNAMTRLNKVKPEYTYRDQRLRNKY